MTEHRYPTVARAGLGRSIRRDLALMSVAIAGVAAAYAATAESTPAAVGTTVAISTAAAMHARLAMARWWAAAQVVGSAVAPALLGAPPRLVAVLFVTGLAGAELIARFPHRSSSVKVSAWVAAIGGAASLSGIAAIVPLPARTALDEGLAALIGGFLSTPLLLAVSPLAERLFGHITRLTMSDWLSYEHPLLRELAERAPGTFQHSINVGVLADAAAGAIRADALLARVGGLYHDVGKMNAPEYFVENQHDANPHDQLPPAESARILRAHVTDGVDLITRHRMGDRIADFVREHHGTGEMRLLREKASSRGEDVEDGTYRYPGPEPQSRETGIVMIADQLDATARAEPPPDEAACDVIVQNTIERIRREGQLEQSGLTEGDLATAARAFARALQAMYHKRMSYPPSDAGVSRPSLVVPRRRRRGLAS